DRSELNATFFQAIDGNNGRGFRKAVAFQYRYSRRPEYPRQPGLQCCSARYNQFDVAAKRGLPLGEYQFPGDGHTHVEPRAVLFRLPVVEAEIQRPEENLPFYTAEFLA